MPNTTELLQFGPFVALVFFLGWAAWGVVPKVLAMHEAIVTKIAADSKAAVEKLTVEHKETVERLTEDYKGMVERLTSDFRAELKDQRDWHEVLMRAAEKK